MKAPENPFGFQVHEFHAYFNASAPFNSIVAAKCHRRAGGLCSWAR